MREKDFGGFQEDSYYSTTSYLDTQTFKIADDKLCTRRQ